MNKTHVLLVLLCAAAAVAATCLVWQEDNAAVHRPDPAAAEQAAAPPAEVGAAVGAVPEAAVAEQTPVVPDGLERVALAVPDVGRVLVVQVWDRQEGVPAPGAQVCLLDGFDGPDGRDPFAQHWSDLAAQQGRRFAADAQGRVELMPVRSRAIVSASLPGVFGCLRIGRDHRDVETITLQPDETVTVRVLDEHGRAAAGVPVGVVQHVPAREEFEQMVARWQEVESRVAHAEAVVREDAGQREAATVRLQSLREQQAQLAAMLGEAKRAMAEGKGGGKGDGKIAAVKKVAPSATRPELRAQRFTGTDGLAVFRHFQFYRRDPESGWSPEQHDRFLAVLMMPLPRDESREFGGRPVPGQTIELRLPPVGSIALRTVDRDGRPFLHPVHADVRVAAGDTAPWARVVVRKEQGQDAIVLPFVGLGLQFTAQCRLDDEDFRWQLPAFAGPDTPGERVAIDLIVAPGEGMLVGRVVDSAGAPLAGARPTFLVNSAAGRLEGEEIVLDANGRFHLPYQVRQHHRPPFRLEIRRDDVRPTAGLAKLLPELPAGIVTDLGDLRISAFPGIAGGVVVDDRGAPVAGALLQLQRERPTGNAQVPLAFADEAFATARSDAEGRFQLFGELEPARHRLHVQAGEHFPFDTPDLRHGEPVRVVLQRRSRLLGTLLRPAWLQAKGVRAELVATGDPRQRREDQIHDAKGNSYVFFDWVRPGVYDLALRVSQFPDPFLRIERLVVEPGQMDPHPRLRDLDLAAWLHRFEIVAVDENGQPVQPERPLLARIQRPDGSTSWLGLPWQKNRVELLSTAASADLIALAEGFAAEPATVVAGASQLRFTRIPPVQVTLAGLRALAGAVNVQVVLEVLDARGLPPQIEAFDAGSRKVAGAYARAKYTAAMLGDDDVATVRLVRQGPHRVILRFGVGQGGGPTMLELPPIDVRAAAGAGAGAQRFAVAYDNAAARAAIDEAARRSAASPQGAGR